MVNGQARMLVRLLPREVCDFVAVDFEYNSRRRSPEVQRLAMLAPGLLRVGSRARQVRVDQGRRRY